MGGQANEEERLRPEIGRSKRGALVVLVQVVIAALIVGLGAVLYQAPTALPPDGKRFWLGAAAVNGFGYFEIIASKGDDHIGGTVYPAIGGRNHAQYFSLKIGESYSVDGWGTLTAEEISPPVKFPNNAPLTGGLAGVVRYTSPVVAWVSWCGLVLAVLGFVLCLLARQSWAVGASEDTLSAGKYVKSRLSVFGFAWVGIGIGLDLVGIPRSFAVPSWVQITGVVLMASSLAGIYLLPRLKRLSRTYRCVLWIVLGLSFIVVAPNPVMVVAGVIVAVSVTGQVTTVPSVSTRSPTTRTG